MSGIYNAPDGQQLHGDGKPIERPTTNQMKISDTARIESRRRAFEKWIIAPPYEREVSRHPNDETKYTWPGQYVDISVQLTWEAWCESANTVEATVNQRKTVP